MARLTRVCPVGVPQHIIQRGNNRQVCFAGDQNFAAYAGWLKDYSKKYQEEALYLLHLYRYIESNPVRAGMVEHPSDYAWSRYFLNLSSKFFR